MAKKFLTSFAKWPKCLYEINSESRICKNRENSCRISDIELMNDTLLFSSTTVESVPALGAEKLSNFYILKRWENVTVNVSTFTRQLISPLTEYVALVAISINPCYTSPAVAGLAVTEVSQVKTVAGCE
uniref:Uncharacterized protein n=1 Tax=Romanomermis culicivorax TaxID=13658 RepID=A0A915ID20_ROMCU